MRMVSQAKLKKISIGGGPKWTIRVYHTYGGNANTI